MNALERKIRSKNIVSFDIFDTLVKRNVGSPRDIFDVVQRNYNSQTEDKINGFREKRIAAEHCAREETDREEISYSDIYDRIDYPATVREKLKELETDTEIRFCQSNTEMKRLYDKCIELGKTIIIISDMYLPKDVIERMMEKSGYKQYTKLYLSSDIGRQKATGSLYEYMIRDLGCRASDIVHIGDSTVSDFIRPMSRKISAIKISREVNHTYFAEDELIFKKNNTIYPFINNNIDKSQPEFFRWGYEALGPLILGYCQWIHSMYVAKGLDKAYFLARDMYLFIDVYRQLYPDDDVTYLEVSRKSLRAAYVMEKNTIEAIYDTLGREKYTLQRLIESFGIDVAVIRDRYNLRLDWGKSYEENDKKDTERLQISVFNEIGEQARNTKRYLAEMGIDGKGSYAIVDIGWHGTIQNMLEEILHRPFMGLYLGNTKRKDFHYMESYGYWYNNDDEEAVLSNISMVGVLEEMLFPNVGTTIGYNIEKGKICVIRANSENDDFHIIKQFQDGAKKLIHDYVSVLGQPEKISQEVGMHAYLRLAFKPDINVAKKLSRLVYEDNKFMMLASFDGWLNYLRNPRKLFYDYGQAKWKIGFIKQALPWVTCPDLIDARIKNRRKL